MSLELSAAETDLYKGFTIYVPVMNQADRIGHDTRSSHVGFALPPVSGSSRARLHALRPPEADRS